MLHSAHPPLRLAVLISGGGRTMLNLQNEIAAGRLPAEIAVVLSSRPGIKGIERAQSLGLPTGIVPRKQYSDTDTFSQAVFAHIRDARAELVVLAGFLSLLTIPEDYCGRVINIHPALLPEFGGHGMFGHHVHQAVLDAGRTLSGCSVHFADAEYDTGPVILQRTCPVEPGDDPDTLAARVFAQECIAYPEAIRLLAAGRVLIKEGKVVVFGEEGGVGTEGVVGTEARRHEGTKGGMGEKEREGDSAAELSSRNISSNEVGSRDTDSSPAEDPSCLRASVPSCLPAKARAYCNLAHSGQFRAGGQPYATHPAAVADILRRHGVTDPQILAAAYLHDVIEDTETPLWQLERAFTARTADLVRQLTIPNKPTGPEKHAAIIEHAKKMDADARLIKLADRLHNLSQMREGWPPEKQSRYAKATIELLETLKPWPNEKLAGEIEAVVGEYV